MSEPERAPEGLPPVPGREPRPDPGVQSVRVQVASGTAARLDAARPDVGTSVVMLGLVRDLMSGAAHLPAAEPPNVVRVRLPAAERKWLQEHFPGETVPAVLARLAELFASGSYQPAWTLPPGSEPGSEHAQVAQ
ncbi:hypothetical protein AB0M43_37590 [Longispora sp. NPDC051575]|uniref:hypothetical protein n=1 Tax=Longispora sp. NPDC051575 TaxID=3154943 RepID=UPI003440ED57